MYESNEPGSEFQKLQLANQSAQKPPPPPGKVMIMVVGIIMIVFSFFSFLTTLALMPSLGKFGGGYIPLMIFELALAGCTIAFGIIGLINAGKAAKAQNIINMGLLLCALIVIDLIAGAIVASVNAAVVFFVMLGLVLPILLIVGGNQNKKSLQS